MNIIGCFNKDKKVNSQDIFTFRNSHFRHLIEFEVKNIKL